MLGKQQARSVGTVTAKETKQHPMALESYFDASQEAAIILDIRGSVIYANQRALDLINYERTDIIGKNFPSLPIWTPGSLKTAHKLVCLNKQEGAIGPEELELIRKDGSHAWIALFSNQVLGPSGKLITITMFDITRSKRDNEIIQEERDRTKQYLDIAGTILLALDRDAKITMLNRRGCEILGGEEREFIGKDWFTTFIPEDIRESMRNGFDRMMAGEDFPYEHVEPHVVITLTGCERIVVWRNSLVRDKRGNIIGSFGSGEDVTEWVCLEKALQETREIDDILLNNAPNQVVMFNPDMSVRYVNPSWVKLNGWTSEEVVGMKPPFPWWPKDQRATLAKAFTESFGKGPATGEIISYKKNGEAYWLSMSWTPVKSEGKLIYLLVNSVDISEHKRAEEALRESEERFSKAFNASPESVIITSVEEGTFVEVNNGYTDLTGYSREESIGRTTQDIGIWVHLPDRERMVRLLRENGQIRNEEFEFRCKSGQVRTFLLSAEPISISGKACIISSSFDITERKQAEDLLKTLADSSPIGVYIAQDGMFKHVNQPMVDILNQPFEKIMYSKTTDFILPKDRVMTRKNAIAMLKGERSHPYAYRVVDMHGDTRYAMETVASIIYQGKRAVLGNIMDVTQMEIMQDELRRHRDHLEELVSQRTTELTAVNRRLEDELVHRQEVEAALVKAKEAAEVASQAKSEFLAHMSHEIRTPIHGMIGMVNLALDCRHETERQQYLGMALSSADALQSVINDILDLSKIEAGQLEMLHEDFNLLTVVEDATEVLAPLAFKKGLELTVYLAADVPTVVNGDASHLRQVITNLLGNAIKFTMHGEVALRVEKIANHRTMTEVLFSVRDTGIGIPENKQQIIFDPFSQADSSINREYGGTGLGLAIARHLIHDMNGRLWVESKPNKGSTFYFTANFKKARTTNNIPATLPKFPGRSALIVEGNSTSREILKDLLKRMGFSITAAASGKEACKLFTRDNKETYDLTIVDRILPDMDGLDLGVSLRKQTPQVAFIMLLAPDTISTEYHACVQAGLTNYLVKPARTAKLAEAIHTAFGMAPQHASLLAAIPAPDDEFRLRVLVAEDNATSQLVARKMLEKMGYTVSIASNGLEATRLAEGDAFDLILMDVDMPIMNGIEATRRIRKAEKSAGRHLPIIALTAYAMKSDRDKCLEAGMDAYLSKPAKPNEINALVRSFFTGHDRPATEAAVYINEAMKIFGEDEELLHEAAGIFMGQDYPEQMDAIREGLEKQDAEAVRIAAHSIKGAARSLGSNTLADVALRLEEAGRNADLSHADELVTEIEREATRLVEYFAANTNC